MTKSERIGFIGGSAGASIGSLVWAVFLGLKIGQIWIVLGALLGMVIGVYVPITLYKKYSDKRKSIMGVLIFWLTSINFVLANTMFRYFPEIESNPSANIDIVFFQINIMLFVMSAAGMGFIISDISKKQ